MVLDISPSRTNSSSAVETSTSSKTSPSSTGRGAATAIVAASLITCCAGAETGLVEDYYDDDGDDSFVAPRKIADRQQQQRREEFSVVKTQQRRNRFTSSPLIHERDSSLISGSFVETSPRENNGHLSSNSGDKINAPSYIAMRRSATPPTPSMTMTNTPPRSASRRKKHHPAYTPNRNGDHPPQTEEPPSPAVELSMAKQYANETQFMARSRSHNLHHLASPSSKAGGAPVTRQQPQQQPQPSKTIHHHHGQVFETAVAAMSIESPTKKARQDGYDNDTDEEDELWNNDSSPVNNNNHLDLVIQESYCSGDADSIATMPPPPPPATTTTSRTPPQQHSKIKKSTIIAQTSSFSSTEVTSTNYEYKKNIVIWKHYTKAMLDAMQVGHLHHSITSLLWDAAASSSTTTTTTGGNSSSSSSINEELNNTYKFPRMYIQNPIELLLLNNNNSGNTTATSSPLGELWWYKLQLGAESTIGHVQAECIKEHQQRQQQQQRPQQQQQEKKKQVFHRGNSDATSSSVSSSSSSTNLVVSPSAQPTNVWSEPSASTIKVRGQSYTKDGVKVSSEESMFAVLGVDNFVKKEKGSGGIGGEDMIKSGTSNFLERWKKVCEDVGVECVPFLLVFNFIVPWGNFQIYLIRPDADNGPYSSNHSNSPSEKAWKSFLEGNTEYRNAVLKFIPRMIAGPWMVKKMVGSTPALIGQKLPVSYRGSMEENYLEVSLDVTQGPALGNTIANTVVGKADLVTIDLGFLIEGQEKDGTLPEQMLGLVRLHHLNMKRAFTHAKWKEELRLRLQR